MKEKKRNEQKQNKKGNEIDKENKKEKEKKRGKEKGTRIKRKKRKENKIKKEKGKKKKASIKKLAQQNNCLTTALNIILSLYFSPKFDYSTISCPTTSNSEKSIYP